jgi:hypothetical protein
MLEEVENCELTICSSGRTWRLTLGESHTADELGSLIGGGLDQVPTSEAGSGTLSGSFSNIYVHERFCIRYSPVRGNGREFLKRLLRVYRIITTDDICLYDMLAFGTCTDPAGNLLGAVGIMERLYPLSDSVPEESLFSELSRISRSGFHNDFTLANIMQRLDGKVCAIDYDLFDPTKVVIAVSGHSMIEFDFAPLHLKDTDIQLLRQLFDYTLLSLCMSGSHRLYPSVLSRLEKIFRSTEETLTRIVEYCETTKNVLHSIPIEVMVKVPDIEATTVNVFDLRGNAFAHNIPNWESYPSLVRSNGVYWPSQTHS